MKKLLLIALLASTSLMAINIERNEPSEAYFQKMKIEITKKLNGIKENLDNHIKCVESAQDIKALKSCKKVLKIKRKQNRENKNSK